jgi:acyl-CoA synthetase (AMP-forming)/AMP-acid ligase II
MINMAGLATAFCTALRLGATIVQHHPFNLEVFLQQIRDEAIDYTVAPPAVLNMLLQNEALLSGIDSAACGASGQGRPLCPSGWSALLPSATAFRSSTTSDPTRAPRWAVARSTCPDPRQRALYFPRAGGRSPRVLTRLVDLDTERDITEPGQVGELRYDGPTVFSGYFNAPELTAKAFDAQGFYKSGDLFEIAGDQGQFYRYVGRSKDLVIRGGVNISSEEIEGCCRPARGSRRWLSSVCPVRPWESGSVPVWHPCRGRSSRWRC